MISAVQAVGKYKKGTEKMGMKTVTMKIKCAYFEAHWHYDIIRFIIMMDYKESSCVALCHGTD